MNNRPVSDRTSETSSHPIGMTMMMMIMMTMMITIINIRTVGGLRGNLLRDIKALPEGTEYSLTTKH
jgi:hypothetical protein